MNKLTTVAQDGHGQWPMSNVHSLLVIAVILYLLHSIPISYCGYKSISYILCSISFNAQYQYILPMMTSLSQFLHKAFEQLVPLWTVSNQNSKLFFISDCSQINFGFYVKRLQKALRPPRDVKCIFKNLFIIL